MADEIAKYTPEVFDASIKEKMLALIDEPVYLREVSFALQALNNNDYLRKCSKASILTAVYNTATTGLSLNPVLKFAALVPRYVKSAGGTIAILEPQYQGLVKLVTDTGSVKSAYAYCVFEGDEFTTSLGTEVEIIHKPAFKSKVITHAYAVAILPDGKKQIEVMDKADLDYIRSLSESYKAFKSGNAKSAIWVDHEGEMCKKTVLKRLVKYLPKTDQYERLAMAIDLDNADYEVSDRQEDFLLSLLRTSTYGKDDTGEFLEKKILAGLSQQEFETLKADLMNNQLDPIVSGANYSQGDIKKHLNKLP